MLKLNINYCLVCYLPSEKILMQESVSRREENSAPESRLQLAITTLLTARTVFLIVAKSAALAALCPSQIFPDTVATAKARTTSNFMTYGRVGLVWGYKKGCC